MKSESLQTQEMKSGIIENTAMLTFSEASLYLKVSKSFLYKATAERNIPFFKPTRGKLIYFSRSDLDEWLTQNRYASKKEITG